MSIPPGIIKTLFKRKASEGIVEHDVLKKVNFYLLGPNDSATRAGSIYKL